MNIQVGKISTDFSRYCYALRAIRENIGVETALATFHAYVQSKLRYGVIFWGRSCKAERFFKLQKRWLRVLFKMKTTDPTKNYLIEQKMSFIYLNVLFMSLIITLNFEIINWNTIIRQEKKHFQFKIWHTNYHIFYLQHGIN